MLIHSFPKKAFRSLSIQTWKANMNYLLTGACVCDGGSTTMVEEWSSPVRRHKDTSDLKPGTID